MRKFVRQSAPLAAALLLGCSPEHASFPEVGTTSAGLSSSSFDRDGCLGPGCSGGLQDGEFDIVVVGSGAGGGPLAARLAQHGKRVLLLEAGEDAGERLTYQIPAWHGLASEDPAMRWDYFVDHYDDPAQAARDEKLVRAPDGRAKGIYYPRGSALGGSTALNAMIAVAPHASDWEGLADTLQAEDPARSFRAEAMRAYFARAENSQYMPRGTPGHGFGGWMYTGAYLDDFFDYMRIAVDLKMARVVAATVLQAGRAPADDRPFDLFKDLASLKNYLADDLNEEGPARDGREGAFRLPEQTRDGKRASVRELLMATVSAGHPLTIQTRALVSKVLFDTGAATPRATGVEWIAGKGLYDASPSAAGARGALRRIGVSGEVVLSAGAFNTPQLLMLSGVGDRAELDRHGIPSVVHLPGVGKNLQDRYEVGVVGEVSSMLGDQFRTLKNCGFDPSKSPTELAFTDPCYTLWKHKLGVYTSNGSVVGVVKRSRPELADPDLFLFGIPGYFKGYWPGYSQKALAEKTHFTWAILKAHTHNTSGTVSLASADPRTRPDVRFRYFEGDGGQADLDALTEGVSIAREMVARTKSLSPPTDDFREVYPGPNVSTRPQVSQFVRDNAWGHHACCTAKIGKASDPSAVLDARFRVRGTQGLRVVDASVFPKIPGFFLAVPTYMISEKAADTMLEDAR